jgi:hypothetical protein
VGARSLANKFLDLKLLFFLYEALFLLNGNVNIQSYGYWCSEKLHEVHLHDPKVAVWCAASACKIICRVFLKEILNS